MSEIVEVEGLSRRFGGKQALANVSYRAGEGLVYGLVGVNGAGKTTLIKHMLGLLRAKSGSVRIFGEDPARHPVEVLREVGYLSEERDLPDWTSIRQLLTFTKAHFPTWDDAYAEELLETFKLDPTNLIKNLSKGMRAQAGLIAAVAHRPRLLILDEPSSGLDAVVREDILNAVLRAVSEDGRTVIFSSHLLYEVERMSDHVTMINAGTVHLDGRLDELQARHQTSEISLESRNAPATDLPGVLSAEVIQDSRWKIVHETSAGDFTAAVTAAGGSVEESRTAMLLEVFVARVGRGALESAE